MTNYEIPEWTRWQLGEETSEMNKKNLDGFIKDEFLVHLFISFSKIHFMTGYDEQP